VTIVWPAFTTSPASALLEITTPGASARIERGSPWENGYIESFNARLRDELLNVDLESSARARVRALWGLSGWRGNERIVSGVSRQKVTVYQSFHFLSNHSRSPFWTNAEPVFSALMAGEFLLTPGRGDVYSIDDAASWTRPVGECPRVYDSADSNNRAAPAKMPANCGLLGRDQEQPVGIELRGGPGSCGLFLFPRAWTG
jgi:hypothetical protein